jgi:NADH-ubiquinone oxidoreductase chain 5
MGFPFLAGFYSKDVILEVSYAKHTISGHFSFILGVLAAFSTAFYSIRLLFLVFLANPNANKNVLLNAHEGTWRMTLPLFLLSLLSIFIGFLSKDFFIGFGTNFWGSAIFIAPQNYLLTDIEFLELGYKILPLVVTLLGAFAAFFIYNYQLLDYLTVKKSSVFKSFYNFFNKKWYFDKLYNTFVGQKVLDSSYNYFYKVIDRGLIEKVGPTGILNSFVQIIRFIKKLQNGFMISYLINILGFMVVFLLFSFEQALFSFFIFSLAVFFSYCDEEIY